MILEEMSSDVLEKKSLIGKVTFELKIMIKKQMFKPKFKPIARGGWGELAIRGLGYIDCKIIFFTIYSF